MRLLCLTALLVAAFWARADEQKNSFYPPAFASREAAEESTQHLFAGGDVDVLHVGNKNVLIYIVHGSGVPDIGIAAYFSKNGAWEFAKSIWPSPGEFHKVIVSGNEIVVVGERSKKQWPFLKVD
ncbi:MAG TPA: hypothetical protein VKS98_03540 [Chthoniobacterales bacterium]|nr:hypothetical protein [Chthoniobacterales bacterium]